MHAKCWKIEICLLHSEFVCCIEKCCTSSTESQSKVKKRSHNKWKYLTYLKFIMKHSPFTDWNTLVNTLTKIFWYFPKTFENNFPVAQQKKHSLLQSRPVLVLAFIQVKNRKQDYSVNAEAIRGTAKKKITFSTTSSSKPKVLTKIYLRRVDLF